jgi:hypothetical protein
LRTFDARREKRQLPVCSEWLRREIAVASQLGGSKKQFASRRESTTEGIPLADALSAFQANTEKTCVHARS